MTEARGVAETNKRQANGADPALALAPPHSPETELNVLGSLMSDNGTWPTVSESVTETDFWIPRNRMIFAAIQTLAESGRAFGPLSVAEFLSSKSRSIINGVDVVPDVQLADLAEIVRNTITQSSIGHHVEVLCGLKDRRRLIEL